MSFEKNIAPSEGQEPLHEQEESGGYFDFVREAINRIVESKQIRNEQLGYDSTVGVYGGKLREEGDGKLVWDNTDLASRLDRWGDRVLRAWDEHHVKDPIALLRRSPEAFLHMLPLVADAKRFRGNTEQIMENVRRLGLEDLYGAHTDGIEIKQRDIYSKGVNLQDIFHADELGSEKLSGIDRFEAVEQAGEYVGRIHASAGAIGEILGNDIIFMNYDGGSGVGSPVLNLPDEIYNPEKSIGENEKMATDMLDFMASIGSEEWRRSDDWTSVGAVLDRLLNKYENVPVLLMVRSFAKRGRLTLPGEKEIDETLSASARVLKSAFQAHNVQRLKVATEMTTKLRGQIIEACDRAISLKGGLVASA